AARACHARPQPRTLPSFPTRRSSDLPAGVLGRRILDLVEVGPRVLELVLGFVGRDAGVADVRFQIGVVADRVIYRHAAAAGTLVDRKSTRLNSSHVSTSYAVVCLQKK